MSQGRTIVDDRGSVVPAFSMRLHIVGLDARTISPEERDLLSKLAMASAVRRDGCMTYASMVGFTAAGMMILTATLSSAWLPGLASWHRMLITVGLTYGVVVVIGLFYKDTGAIRAARTLVGHGWCGSCVYPLRDVHEEEDGHVQCPECGAAWKAVHLGGLKNVDPPTESAGMTSGLLFRPSLPVVVDDRERLVFVANPNLDVLERRFDRHEATRIAMLLGERGITNASAFALVSMGCACLGMVWAAARVGSTAAGIMPKVLGVCIGIGTMIAIFFLISHFSRARNGTDQERGPRIRKRLLADSRCASCARSLEATPMEADGCRVCKACGSAWKMGA